MSDLRELCNPIKRRVPRTAGVLHATQKSLLHCRSHRANPQAHKPRASSKCQLAELASIRGTERVSCRTPHSSSIPAQKQDWDLVVPSLWQATETFAARARVTSLSALALDGTDLITSVKVLVSALQPWLGRELRPVEHALLLFKQSSTRESFY